MKRFIQLLMLTAVISFGLTSCGDPCDKTDCGFGTCSEGDCTCSDFYIKDAEGSCTVGINTEWAGTYTAQATCDNAGSYSDTLQVEVGANPNEVIVRNFQGAANNDIVLTVDASDNITIDQTDYTGSGILSGSVFNFALNSTTDSCQVTLTKQQ